MGEQVSSIPKEKKKAVMYLAEKFKKAETVLVASTKSLPASQFQKIGKSLRGKAEIIMAKRSMVNRALDSTEKGALISLKKHILADFALFLSDLDAFELSGMLSENQSPTKAKAGDISPEDIVVEPGPTDLIPGPAISELGSVGLKVAVEDGKLSIKKGATIVKKGNEIDEKVAGVMAKLGIEPIKVGFIPVAAYDAKADKVYVDIKIDKDLALIDLRIAISKAFGFAINVGYVCKETIGWFIGKAGLEATALDKYEGKEVEKKKENNSEETEAVESVKTDNSEDVADDNKVEEESKEKGVEDKKKDTGVAEQDSGDNEKSREDTRIEEKKKDE
jgi:large subunit ribosomal protein L10